VASPVVGQNLDLANRTQASIKCLLADGPHHGPWIATMAFYKAVHVVEAVFLRLDGGPRKRSSSHDDRDNRLRRDTRFAHILKAYRPLFNASLVARYLSSDGQAYPDFEAYMPASTVLSELIHNRLHQVEESASRLVPDLKFDRCNVLQKTFAKSV
jgi:hypothetical protein